MENLEYANAYSEVNEILKSISKEDYEKIPKSKIELFNHSIIMGKIAGNEGAIGKYISQVFQKLVINQKVIYVHASCVSKGNDGVIIIGDFGQGKTSVALECTIQDKEVQLLSDNGIAIKDNKIIGYANSIALRTVNTNMLNKIDDKEVTLKCDNMTFFDFEPNLIGSINIKSIIIPHINAEDNNIYNVDEEKYGLAFTLLADPERKVIEAYDVWKEKKNYGKISMGVVRTTYLIDEQGVIIKANDKVKAADDPENMLKELEG